MKESNWLNIKSNEDKKRESQSTEVLFIEQANRFLKEGGYRLYPSSVSLPLIVNSDRYVKIDSPAKAMKKRMGYVSKDRDVESLCLNASIEDNISIAGMSKFAVKDFLVLKNREKKYVNQQIEELSIKCSGRDQAVSQLSGGNKQKVVFGKWIGCGSEILILDCPTRGVDIGVKQAMYQLMVKLKNEGKSILMISEEMPELIGMSDRILIMKDGEITAEFERNKNLSDSQIIEYMI
jgi:ribose transport system ATP-binding protein